MKDGLKLNFSVRNYSQKLLEKNQKEEKSKFKTGINNMIRNEILGCRA